MNPLEALNLLTNAANMARLTKQEHVQLEQAVQVLHAALQKKAENADTGKPRRKAGPKA